MPDYTRPLSKPLGVLPDGKKHVPKSGLFGGATIDKPGVKVGVFDEWKKGQQGDIPAGEPPGYRFDRKKKEPRTETPDESPFKKNNK